MPWLTGEAAELLDARNAMPDVEYSFAFQPIVDAFAQRVFSYEALIRGLRNEPASKVLERVPAQHQHQFDLDSRAAAVTLAARLGIVCHLNLNFLPRSLDVSEMAIRMTLDTAHRCGISADRVVLEVAEGEMIDDHVHFVRVVNRYRAMGLKVAIDDFGAGYSGLNMLADFQPDVVKLDMHLLRGIESNGPRQAIVRAINQVCLDLGIDVTAEGVETLAEYAWLKAERIQLFQYHLFARPGFESLPVARYP